VTIAHGSNDQPAFAPGTHKPKQINHLRAAPMLRAALARPLQ